MTFASPFALGYDILADDLYTFDTHDSWKTVLFDRPKRQDYLGELGEKAGRFLRRKVGLRYEDRQWIRVAADEQSVVKVETAEAV